jgi:hypothetical protein
MTPVSTMIPVAVTRGRRRRIAGMASRTVAVAVPVVLVGLVAFTLRPGGYLRNDLGVTTVEGSPTSTAPIVSTAPAPVESSSAPMPTPTTSDEAAARPCSGSALAASGLYSGQEMNQPYTVVRVTNMSSTACVLDGYPEVTLTTTGISPAGPSPVQAPTLAVTRGSIMQVEDPGSTSFVVKPGGQAWFAVGTGLAYDPPLLDIDTLKFGVAGGGSRVAVAGLRQQITGLTGKPLPITVTAFAPGTPSAP